MIFLRTTPFSANIAKVLSNCPLGLWEDFWNRSPLRLYGKSWNKGSHSFHTWDIIKFFKWYPKKDIKWTKVRHLYISESNEVQANVNSQCGSIKPIIKVVECITSGRIRNIFICNGSVLVSMYEYTTNMPIHLVSEVTGSILAGTCSPVTWLTNHTGWFSSSVEVISRASLIRATPWHLHLAKLIITNAFHNGLVNFIRKLYTNV